MIYSVRGMAFIMDAELSLFLYMVLRSSFSAISASSVDMAHVTGASRWQVWSRVILPSWSGLIRWVR